MILIKMACSEMKPTVEAFDSLPPRPIFVLHVEEAYPLLKLPLEKQFGIDWRYHVSGVYNEGIVSLQHSLQFNNITTNLALLWWTDSKITHSLSITNASCYHPYEFYLWFWVRSQAIKWCEDKGIIKGTTKKETKKMKKYHKI